MKRGVRPLGAIKQELRQHGQCTGLPLGPFSVDDVGEYLSARFPLQQLPRGLGRAIHQATEGNPLFVVNPVDYWTARALLVMQDGRMRRALRRASRSACERNHPNVCLSRAARQLLEEPLRRHVVLVVPKTVAPERLGTTAPPSGFPHRQPCCAATV